MHKNLGSQGSRVAKVFALLSALLLSASSSWAATQLLIVMPGQSYTPGSAPSMATPLTQVAGESITGINVYSYDNSTNQPTNPLGVGVSVSITCFDATAINPSGSFNLPETYGGQSYTLRSGVSATIVPATSRYVPISVTGSYTGNNTSIYVQRITTFTFTHDATLQAGDNESLQIQARDASNLCNAYNGSATLSCVGGGVNGSDRSLGTIYFVDGVCNTTVALFYATTNARFRVQKTTSPSVDVTESTPFTVAPAVFSKLLIIGPGQTIRSGELGGNGRASTSTTTSSQTAGVTYYVTVYAVDAYWNPATGISSTLVDLTCAGDPGFWRDGTFTFVGATNFHRYAVRMEEAGTQVLSTSNSSVTENTDNVPVSPAALDHFAFSTIGASQIAGVGISITITAVDAYGNQVSSVPGTTTFEVLDAGTTPLSTTYQSYSMWPTLSSATFTSGRYMGTVNIKKANANDQLRITNSTLGSPSLSNTFNVSANNTTTQRIIVIMPGQTYTPGERHDGIWGRDNSPSNRTAGVAFSVTLRTTDTWGNLVSNTENITWTTSNLTISDTSASCSPNPIPISLGTGSSNFTLTRATTQQVLTVTSPGKSVTDSGQFTVLATSIHHFAISAGTSQTAGIPFQTYIYARDTYDNDITTYNTTVYLTCPSLDYSSPTQSVLQPSTGTPYYTSVSTTACWQIPGSNFVGGRVTLNTSLFRAGSGALFVSTVPADTPTTHTGYYGSSSTISVVPRSVGQSWTMFCLVPGLEHRPGALDNPYLSGYDGNGHWIAGDGYYGSASSQQMGTPFSITAYATDLYYNIITGATDQFTTTTSPDTSTIHNQSYTLSAGQRQITMVCNGVADYSISLSSPSPGIIAYTTTTLKVFSIDHFTMELMGGGALPSMWVAGTPVNVSICAYQDATNRATTFDGYAELSCTLDHSATLKTIRPATPVHFVNGVWQGEVTLFRADRYQGEANAIKVKFYNTESTSNTLHVAQDDASQFKMLIVAPGMTRYAGLNPDVWADFKGADGQPAVQTAGNSLTSIAFYLCDRWWNQVTSTAAATETITVTCSDGDPFPARIGGQSLASGVTLTLGSSVSGTGIELGKYECKASNAATAFVLYNVNGTAGHTLRVQKTSGKVATAFELGSGGFNAIPVKHQDWVSSSVAHFGFQFTFPNSDKTAGVPFQVTVAAIDAYGNTLDSINGGVAFPAYPSPGVSLSAETDAGGNPSIWPKTLGTMTPTQWIEGVCKPWVYCYKKVTGGGQRLTAQYNFGQGNRTGSSLYFTIRPNEYRRIVPIITGMSLPDATGAGGTYINSSAYNTSPPPADALVFNNFGAPSQQVAGTVPAMLRGYSCDIYGNVVQYPTVPVHLTSTDRFAPLPSTDPVVNAVNGYASYSTFAFHSRGTATITMADSLVTTATAGTTPNISIVPGPFYGLQILSPGLVAVEGAGNSGVSGIIPIPINGWYSGVTPTETDPLKIMNIYNGRAQFAGAAFGVTVQASDIFGNFVGSSAPGDTIRLISDDMNGSSTPSVSVPLETSLVNGIAYFSNVQLRTEGPRQIKPSDITDPTKLGDPHSLCVVRIVQGDEVSFVVKVNGVKVEDNTPVLLETAPNTFTVRVEVQFDGTKEIVSTSNAFIMETFLDRNTPPTPANGILYKTDGVTYFGVADVLDQTYSRAEYVYIRVRDAAGTGSPKVGYSPQLRFSASAPATITMWSDASSYTSLSGQTAYQTEANHTSRVYARVMDINQNPVTNVPVTMTLNTSGATTSTLEVPVSGINTDSDGTIYTLFHAGAQNLEHVIQAVAGSAQGQLSMYVTVTSNGGVYPNPFNPLLGPTHIDYRLEQNAPVKLQVYTLFGDLVWSKEYAAGSDGGSAGVRSILWDGKNNVGETVANGGYIAIVKVNDREQYRFKIGVYKER